MDKLDPHALARMIDISCVRADVEEEEVDRMVEMAKKYKFIAAYAMPCYTARVAEALKEEKEVMVGGVVGFPSGADTTEMKVKTAKELLEIGADELDMVINVGELLSHNYEAVEKDIESVVRAAGDVKVKCIIEASYLTDEDIIAAAKIVADSGASYIKTATGWGPKLTTVDNIKLIKSVVGDRVKIKAAGGVRSLDTLLAMKAAGCERFGVALRSADKIMQEARARFEEQGA